MALLEYDRRTSTRFPVSLDARIRSVAEESGSVDASGETVNISLRGLLLNSNVKVRVGTPVEIKMDWPALRDDSRLAFLIAQGAVVRTEKGRVAVAVNRYDLRFVR